MLAVSMLALSEPNGLGRTPPMGFNPYNHMKASGYTFNPNETTIRATAAALKSSGLQALGYTYVNLDAGWSLPARDAQGRPQPNASRYPNLASGKLASWLHSEGFKFGIYSDSGTLHCGGGGPGGLGHEEIDAKTYASWGVDFLKYDNCNVPANETAIGPIPRYTAMSKALNATGRPIFFAMCEWGDADPATWGAAVANSWRTTGDISDLWWAMVELADLTQEWFEFAAPGGWNDPDLLEVGNGGMTTAEYRSQMAIWSVIKAPLLISTDVTKMSEDTLAILSNAELIAINQDTLGVAGRLVEERPPDPTACQVWAGPLSGGRVAAVMWNRGNASATFFARFYSMQFSGKAKVRDAIAHKDLGTMDGQVELTVASHDVRVVVLTPTEAPAADDAAWAAKWKGRGIRYPLSRKVREAARPRG